MTSAVCTYFPSYFDKMDGIERHFRFCALKVKFINPGFNNWTILLSKALFNLNQKRSCWKRILIGCYPFLICFVFFFSLLCGDPPKRNGSLLTFFLAFLQASVISHPKNVTSCLCSLLIQNGIPSFSVFIIMKLNGYSRWTRLQISRRF